ncbi:MAG: DNA polymerase ligase N-terminal domain-containing protein [Thermoplasmata archaeon]
MTGEDESDQSESSGKPIFVIQKHDATTLHYDLRLEVSGVLKSWAVPKGPSTNPRVKRLAIPTGEHSLEHADFEGVIPEGEYGAGAVIVWDRGTYRNIRRAEGKEVPMEEAIRQGHVSVWLKGEKLKGGYALVRTRRKDEQWLLVKMDDGLADPEHEPTVEEPRSVISGRTIEEIAQNAEGSKKLEELSSE